MTTEKCHSVCLLVYDIIFFSPKIGRENFVSLWLQNVGLIINVLLICCSIKFKISLCYLHIFHIRILSLAKEHGLCVTQKYASVTSGWKYSDSKYYRIPEYSIVRLSCIFTNDFLSNPGVSFRFSRWDFLESFRWKILTN